MSKINVKISRPTLYPGKISAHDTEGENYFRFLFDKKICIDRKKYFKKNTFKLVIYSDH